MLAEKENKTVYESGLRFSVGYWDHLTVVATWLSGQVYWSQFKTASSTIKKQPEQQNNMFVWLESHDCTGTKKSGILEEWSLSAWNICLRFPSHDFWKKIVLLKS